MAGSRSLTGADGRAAVAIVEAADLLGRERPGGGVAARRLGTCRRGTCRRASCSAGRAREAATGPAPWRCSACGSPLELALPPADAATLADTATPADTATLVDDGTMGVWRYRGWLPDADPVRLGEPTTAMVELAAGGHGAGGAADRTVLAKLEGALPTGSFKDRGTAVTVVVAAGARRRRDRRRLVGQRGGLVRRLRRHGRDSARASSCPPTPHPRSCSRPGRTGRPLVTVPGPPVRRRRRRPSRGRRGRARCRLRLAPLASGVPRWYRRRSPTRSTSSSGAGHRMPSWRRSVAARCSSASISASRGSATPG